MYYMLLLFLILNVDITVQEKNLYANEVTDAIKDIKL